MLTVALLGIAAVTLILDFIRDFQDPGGPSFLPKWLRSSRSRLWLRTVVLALALTALGINQWNLMQDKEAADTSADELRDKLSDLGERMTGLQERNDDLNKQNTALKSAIDAVQGMLKRYVQYGQSAALNTNPHGIIDFGLVTINTDSKPVVFSAENIGIGQCGVDITVTDKKGQSAFRISRQHIELAAAQGPETFEVIFHPSTTGPNEAELMIRGTPPCTYDNPTLTGIGR